MVMTMMISSRLSMNSVCSPVAHDKWAAWQQPFAIPQEVQQLGNNLLRFHRRYNKNALLKLLEVLEVHLIRQQLDIEALEVHLIRQQLLEVLEVHLIRQQLLLIDVQLDLQNPKGPQYLMSKNPDELVRVVKHGDATRTRSSSPRCPRGAPVTR